MGGGVFLNKNILSKTKQGLVIGIVLCSGVSNVRAISTNEVTYNNNGVEENLTETLDTLYTELKQYKTGGNVTPSEMLEGSSGYSKGVLVTGSIKKKEATTYTPGVNNITINQGQYLNGNQVIKGDTNLKPENIKSGVSLFGINGTYTSDANAAANQILSGKTAYVKGNKVTGTMANKSGATVEASTITCDENYSYITIPESGYYDTNSKVKTTIMHLPESFELPIILNATGGEWQGSWHNTAHSQFNLGNIFNNYNSVELKSWSQNCQVTIGGFGTLSSVGQTLQRTDSSNLTIDIQKQASNNFAIDICIII